MDFWKQCNRLGHRSDVCPRPNDKLCAGCGRPNPSQEHKCQPRCHLCGMDRPTADKAFLVKFKRTLHRQATLMAPTNATATAGGASSHHRVDRWREVQIPEEGNAWVQVPIWVPHDAKRPHSPVYRTEPERPDSIPLQIPVQTKPKGRQRLSMRPAIRGELLRTQNNEMYIQICANDR
ncbi:hypothetical protein HPB49_015360 [Dermacentor silvarum]|uniref:Uncharacterized protein n=1 Tax=Dermacentor silvarum TaxID=543639 RepID=A0ACB8CFR2_DERSI|nr:hypothetical protein HPB49_015360 [Dermacentor silvarum]